MPRIIAIGDRIEVNHLGRKSWATVDAVDGATIHFTPDSPRFTWRSCRKRDVIDHISKVWTPDQAVFR